MTAKDAGETPDSAGAVTLYQKIYTLLKYVDFIIVNNLFLLKWNSINYTDSNKTICYILLFFIR